ncbi:uncharacterized protein LOC116941531 isoform X4 [Petromyzon marinus]|uniref:uncharacterized protein LOC116941531 isoform X4 n=1 Tax=Petromyzon marinus TaxID=7757 RepID=UPI003F72E4F2
MELKIELCVRGLVATEQGRSLRDRLVLESLRESSQLQSVDRNRFPWRDPPPTTTSGPVNSEWEACGTIAPPPPPLILLLLSSSTLLLLLYSSSLHLLLYSSSSTPLPLLYSSSTPLLLLYFSTPPPLLLLLYSSSSTPPLLYSSSTTPPLLLLHYSFSSTPHTSSTPPLLLYSSSSTPLLLLLYSSSTPPPLHLLSTYSSTPPLHLLLYFSTLLLLYSSSTLLLLLYSSSTLLLLHYSTLPPLHLLLYTSPPTPLLLLYSTPPPLLCSSSSTPPLHLLSTYSSTPPLLYSSSTTLLFLLYSSSSTSPLHLLLHSPSTPPPLLLLLLLLPDGVGGKSPGNCRLDHGVRSLLNHGPVDSASNEFLVRWWSKHRHWGDKGGRAWLLAIHPLVCHGADLHRMASSPMPPEPSGDFPAWLEAQGVNAEVARAMDSELGIRDYGVLRACVGDGLVRAELLAAARDRLPFGFYAVLRQVVKALRGAGTPRWDDVDAAAYFGDATLAALVEVLLALLSGLNRELLQCMQRLGDMDVLKFAAGSPASASVAGSGDGDDAAAEEMADEMERRGKGGEAREAPLPPPPSPPRVDKFSSSPLGVHTIKTEACPEEDSGLTLGTPSGSGRTQWEGLGPEDSASIPDWLPTQLWISSNSSFKGVKDGDSGRRFGHTLRRPPNLRCAVCGRVGFSASAAARSSFGVEVTKGGGEMRGRGG